MWERKACILPAVGTTETHKPKRVERKTGTPLVQPEEVDEMAPTLLVRSDYRTSAACFIGFVFYWPHVLTPRLKAPPGGRAGVPQRGPRS